MEHKDASEDLKIWRCDIVTRACLMTTQCVFRVHCICVKTNKAACKVMPQMMPDHTVFATACPYSKLHISTGAACTCTCT